MQGILAEQLSDKIEVLRSLHSKVNPEVREMLVLTEKDIAALTEQVNDVENSATISYEHQSFSPST